LSKSLENLDCRNLFNNFHSYTFYRVKSIKPAQLSVALCNGQLHGRVHIANIQDDVNEVKII